jgi:hypothetical protein
MKSFKAMMSEVAQPEPAEEKAFKAQHTVVADKHPVALDTQHKGTKPKAKRKADQEGDANYDLAYESADLEEMKVKNSDAAFKLETEISNLEKRIEKLKPLAPKDDDANMKLAMAKKSLKQKQDAHSALMRESAELTEQPKEEIPMMMNQLAFICYAAEEISGMIKINSDPEEWFQNKLAATHSEMKTLYSYMQGQNQMDYMNMGYADDMDEALSPKQKKIDHNNNNKIDGEDLAMIRAKKSVKEELKGNQHKIDKNKNGKIDKHDFKLLKKEAAEKPVSPFDLKNYKSQIPTKAGEKAGFDSKKVSTGTVYSRKPVKEAAYEKDMDEKKKVIVKGVKGMKSTPFTKTFRNMAAYDKWSDSDAAGDYEVQHVMHEEVEQIDELSKKTLNSYSDAAHKDFMKNFQNDQNFTGVHAALRKAMAKTNSAIGGVHSLKGRSKNPLRKDDAVQAGLKTAADAVTAARKPFQHKMKVRNQGMDRADARLNKEEVELDEAFQQGIVKFKDGSSSVLKKEDADILNKLMGGMSSGSVKKMTETAMKDKTGFAEILAFAKEAM